MYRRRRSRPDDSGAYGSPQQGRAPSTSNTRLRRSLRGGAPPTLTKKDRFEKIITYVSEKDNARGEQTIVRQFNMPSYILASAQDVLQTKVNPSSLELLSTDILLDIVNKLVGNDQIVASLSCKVLASVVEAAAPIRKIANLVDYYYSMRRPYELKRVEDGSTDIQFINLGYARPPPIPPTPENWHSMYSYIPYYDESDAAQEQVKDLKNRLRAYLGGEYAWCSRCGIFRLLDAKWWQEFAEYENPGITKKSAKKVKEAVNDWSKKKGSKYYQAVAVGFKDEDKDARNRIWEESSACPAHELLQERKNGKRFIEEEPPKPAKGKKTEAKKGKGRKRKLEESETDSDED